MHRIKQKIEIDAEPDGYPGNPENDTSPHLHTPWKASEAYQNFARTPSRETLTSTELSTEKGTTS
jgi:hypothetical protein